MPRGQRKVNPKDPDTIVSRPPAIPADIFEMLERAATDVQDDAKAGRALLDGLFSLDDFLLDSHLRDTMAALGKALAAGAEAHRIIICRQKLATGGYVKELREEAARNKVKYGNGIQIKAKATLRDPIEESDAGEDLEAPAGDLEPPAADEEE